MFSNFTAFLAAQRTIDSPPPVVEPPIENPEPPNEDGVTFASYWEASQSVRMSNGTTKPLYELAIGDVVRTMAPRLEWVGKMLEADGTYNPEAFWAIWLAGEEYVTPNPQRFNPMAIANKYSFGVPNSTMKLGTATVHELSSFQVNVGQPVAGALRLHTHGPHLDLEGSINLYGNPIGRYRSRTPGSGLNERWNFSQLFANEQADATTGTQLYNAQQLFRPINSTLPPNPGDADWFAADPYDAINSSGSQWVGIDYKVYGGSVGGTYIGVKLKKVDADSSPCFFVNGYLVV